MEKKSKIKKSKVTSEFIPTKGVTGSPQVLERSFNELIRRIEEQKKKTKSIRKVNLQLDYEEFATMIDGLHRAKKIAYLKAELKRANNDAEKFDDESVVLLTKIQWAKEAIPKKGVRLKNYREAAYRLGVEPPKRGKPRTYDPDEVKKYHQKLLLGFNRKNGKLSYIQKEKALKEVMNQFNMTSCESTFKYLSRLKCKNLPSGYNS
ncbi:MAG: hypothetical protein ACQ9MH_13135 [Nitrospinales bacterium]